MTEAEVGRSDPRREIETRLAARREAVARAGRSDTAVAYARLTVFVSALILAWVAFGAHRLSGWWLLAPAAAFAGLAALHERVLRARSRARRAVAFHEAALLRLDHRWAGRGEGGARFATPDHPYAQDLDLFGPGSLFELLDAARTRPGEERLASWLLAPAGPDEVRARQTAVKELVPRLDLREDLAVLGEDVRAGVDAPALSAWGEGPDLLPRGLGPAAVILTALALAAAALWAARMTGPFPFAIAVFGEWLLAASVKGRVAKALGGVARPARELEVLALLLARLERERFEGARLAALRAAIAGPPAASARISGLVRHLGRLEWGQNQLFAPVAALLLWRTVHGVLVERWRRRSGSAIRAWLEAVADLEALSSLAGHAYENPGDVFPEVVPLGPDRPAEIAGDGLRHPLLPSGACVENPVALGGSGPSALLVSGSNMSGKSTYLRTVGANVVLALAGAPVRAARLRLAPFQLGATIRIQDSLQAGRSRFYAEITRLKELRDLAAGEKPLLFLLDELLHGTNSRDRRIGAEAILRGLLGLGAVGIVTTHDLALTELAGEAGAVANAHFEDQVKDGQIAFDYRLRPGVATRSNALALMRAVGLEV